MTNLGHNPQIETIGALSNDLYRVASSVARDSHQAAGRFLIEARKRSGEIDVSALPSYLQKKIGELQALVAETSTNSDNEISLETAEHLLMHSVILSNYCTHQLQNQQLRKVL